LSGLPVNTSSMYNLIIQKLHNRLNKYLDT